MEPAASPIAADGAQRRAQGWRQRLFAIALVAAAVLLYQIAITRVLSVVLWYHWAFLSISMAMLGLGAPGVWFALRPPSPSALPRALLLGAVAVPLSVVAIVQWVPQLGAGAVIGAMAAMLVPMLMLGSAVCLLLLTAHGDRIGRMYGADLAGASLAALAVIPLLRAAPTPQLVAATGALPLAAAWLVAPAVRRAAAAVALALGALLAWPAPFTIGMTKAYDERAAPPLVERWTPTARLAFFDHVLWAPPSGFGWGPGTRAPHVDWPQYWMEQDAGAGTPITRFDGRDLAPLGFLLFDVTTVAYQLAPPRRVAVIGAGGGRDVLSALLGGAEDVDAVELNGAVIDVVSERFREFAGDLYRQPRVHVQIDEGRSFLSRSRGDYDVVQISLIDSWAATAAGAYSLSENNLYTVEAYELYWRTLSARGVMTTSRWIGKDNNQILRLLGMQLQALRRAGVPAPEQHLALVTAGAIGTVLASRLPFTGELHERLRAVCEQRGFLLVHPGLDSAAAPLVRLEDLSTDPRLDLRPASDDRPFFFQTLPVWRPAERAATSGNYDANLEAVRALQLLVVCTSAVTLLLFFLPFALRRSLPVAPGFWRGSGYFACLGLGFMLVEVPWLQRFVLFLGHPSTAATVVLGSLLLGAGIGASCSARLGTARLQRYGLAVAAAVAVVHAASPAVFAARLGDPIGLRTALAIALLVPVGGALGLMFPLGMVRFGDPAKAWFWAVNGACGVFASVVSLVLAMALGFAVVGWLGVGCYVAAWALLQGRAAGVPRAGDGPVAITAASRSSECAQSSSSLS